MTTQNGRIEPLHAMEGVNLQVISSVLLPLTFSQNISNADLDWNYCWWYLHQFHRLASHPLFPRNSIHPNHRHCHIVRAGRPDSTIFQENSTQKARLFGSIPHHNGIRAVDIWNYTSRKRQGSLEEPSCLRNNHCWRSGSGYICCLGEIRQGSTDALVRLEISSVWSRKSSLPK